MNRRERPTYVFLIRIWYEERGPEGIPLLWRGRITHVDDRRQRYFQHLDDIALFLVPYLRQANLRPGMCWRFRAWLHSHGGQRWGDGMGGV
jgi:hypothetical protein